jgi:hypothetical protein
MKHTISSAIAKAIVVSIKNDTGRTSTISPSDLVWRALTAAERKSGVELIVEERFALRKHYGALID